MEKQPWVWYDNTALGLLHMKGVIKKRRDKKGRILRNGECQRKDGLYQYDYVDLDGRAKCLYSWKLEPGNLFPQGKRKCKSLREKEREVQRNIDDGIVPYGG